MEPNNIENQIREKLNNRAIQPSAQSWDRLDAMLSITEEKKTKRSFGWLYIAATLLVFVSVGTFFYNQDGTKINTNKTIVVNENVKDSVKYNAVADKEIPIKKQQSVDERNNTSTAVKNQSSIIAQANQKTNSNPIINTRGIAERSVAKEKEIEFQNSTDVALKNFPKIISPDKEIVIVKSTISNQDAVASVDVKKSESISKVKVNANSLLSEVDGELELTFRDKVLKRVNKNYKEVKVALANRNNQ